MKINQQAKKIVVYILKFIIFLLIIDFCFGLLIRYVFLKQKSGKYYRITYALEKATDDILIFGSSHANRHYVPEVFTEQLGLSCYNAGAQGQGILFHTALQEMIYKRHKPKITILNIDSDWMYPNPGSYERLAELSPYYYKHKAELLPYISLKNKWEKYKLISILYQYNSTPVHIIRYLVSSQSDYKGYLPLLGTMSQVDLNEIDKRSSYGQEIDNNFVTALTRFVEQAQEIGSMLIFVVSPRLDNIPTNSNKSFLRIRQIAKESNISIFDYQNAFTGEYGLFKDMSHLNHDGAMIFSRLVAKDIEKMLSVKMNGKVLHQAQ